MGEKQRHYLEKGKEIPRERDDIIQKCSSKMHSWYHLRIKGLKSGEKLRTIPREGGASSNFSILQILREMVDNTSRREELKGKWWLG